MPPGIYIRTKEHGQHISEARRGHLVSEETRKKLSNFFKGRKVSEEHRQNIIGALKGNKYRLGKKDSDEVRKKKSESRKGIKHHYYGKKFSEEHRKKLRENHKGTLGISYTEETKRKISEAQKGKPRHTVGEKNGMWKGGISFEPYPIEWNETLKRKIRKRDNCLCKVCNQYGNEVHHINYDKKNCIPNNLIVLCRPCHTRTGANREYWMNYLATERY